MPRRNGDREAYEPLDLTPDLVNGGPREAGEGFREWQNRRQRQQREAAERQRTARLNQGIDWSACLVPGCGDDPYLRVGIKAHRRNHEMELPLCIKHQAVAYMQGHGQRDDPTVMAHAVATVIERREQREASEHEADKRAKLASIDGHIYFVRQNGLIKAGWSRDLSARLKAYGPAVEILCHYPGTRDDETLLHRQLSPFRAKGREWYQDCKAIQDMVADIVKRHGPPSESAYWTEPKQPTVRLRKRA